MSRSRAEIRAGRIGGCWHLGRPIADLLDAKTVARFMAKVHPQPNGCHHFGNVSRYGTFGIAGQVYPAHRVAWTIANGEIPAHRLIRHSCDNPRCVNPAHLSPGTCADNMRDACLKERMRSGGGAKLSNEIARAICAASDRGESAETLARRYRVRKQTIDNVIVGRSWRHATGRHNLSWMWEG